MSISSALEQRTPRSAALFARASSVFPGGNTRTCIHQDPYPLAFTRGDGPLLWDLDGNEYVDLYFNGFSMIHGHAYPPVLDVLARTMARGTAWSGSSEEQVALAELLCERVPSAERVRFCVSGTESAMLAAKLSRHVTGRPLLLKAMHGYHGSYDDLEAGLHGLTELPGRTLLAPDGDADAFEAVLAARADEIAAVVLEPASVGSCIAPPREFFMRVAAAAARAGALLVFDECITLRDSPAGMQGSLGVVPDLTLLAKFIGGGVPLGALVGRAEVMDHFDPTRADGIYHSGSFNGAVLASAAGLVTLRDLDAASHAAMDAAAAGLCAFLEAETARLGLRFAVNRCGSLIGLHPLAEQPAQIFSEESRRAYRIFQRACLVHGIYIQPAEGVLGIATQMGDETWQRIHEGFGLALAELASWVATDRA
jgi:glutamate-1-semialdehyde 2,1-aminomutase